MKNFLQWSISVATIFSISFSNALARDYIIYSISQDLPMGNKDEIIRKNFYVDMGKNQGIKKDTLLDVYRVVSVLDPYESKKRFNHRIKIGEIKILHAEESSAIGVLNALEAENETPVFEVGKMMIGDIVTAKVK